jgi:hypothetical protein
MALITLRYFALRALAEPIKITLAYGAWKGVPCKNLCNVPYFRPPSRTTLSPSGDVEYTLEVIQFPEWGGGKKADRSVSLFGALPAAILPNGKLVSQVKRVHQQRYVPPPCAPSPPLPLTWPFPILCCRLAEPPWFPFPPLPPLSPRSSCGAWQSWPTASRPTRTTA